MAIDNDKAEQRTPVRFTIRTVMCLVAVVAGLLALAPVWSDALLVLVVLGVPFGSLCDLLKKVPGNRLSWRRWIQAAMIGAMILLGGWLWAVLAIWSFQRREGFVVISHAAMSDHYEYWGWQVPACATGACLIAYVSILACACLPRQRRGLLWLIVGYAAYLAFAWFVLFAALDIEVFLD
jgi:hypothetical protein